MALLASPLLTSPGLSLAAVGQSVSIAVPMKTQFYQGQGGISMLLSFSSGAVLTGGVQVSNDPLANPQNTAAVQATAQWNNHDILTALTASKNSSMVFPVYAVRLVCTAYTSGTLYLNIGALDYML